MVTSLVRLGAAALIAVAAIYLLGRFEWLVVLTAGTPLKVLRTLVLALHHLLGLARRRLPKVDKGLFTKAMPLTAEQLAQGVWPGWLWVGSVIYTAIAIFLALVEFHLLQLTFAAQDPTAPPPAELPLPLDQLLAITSVTLAVFWGILLLDLLGLTHLGPFARLSPRTRKVGIMICCPMIVSIALMYGALGFWRGIQVDQALNPPSPATAPPPMPFTYLAKNVESPALPTVAPVAVSVPDPTPVLPVPLADEITMRRIPIVFNTALPMLLTISAVAAGWGINGVFVLLLAAIMIILTAALNLGRVLTTVALSLCDALWGLLAYLIRILGGTSRNLWNYVATTDPLGGGPWLYPINDNGQLPSALERLLTEARKRLDELSVRFQNRAYDQAHPPKETENDDK